MELLALWDMKASGMIGIFIGPETEPEESSEMVRVGK